MNYIDEIRSWPLVDGWRTSPSGRRVRLGDGVTLGDGVVLGNWVRLGDGVVVSDGSHIPAPTPLEARMRNHEHHSR